MNNDSKRVRTGQRWMTCGALIAGLAVVLGAFAAHGIDGLFAEKYAGETRTVAGEAIPAAQKYLADFKTATHYQMTHALAIIAVGLLMVVRADQRGRVAAWCFLLGIIFFSGSLYVLTLTGQKWIGMIAPLGGTLLIIGWVAFAVALHRRAKSEG